MLVRASSFTHTGISCDFVLHPLSSPQSIHVDCSCRPFSRAELTSSPHPTFFDTPFHLSIALSPCHPTLIFNQILTAAREAAGLGAGRSSSSSEKGDSGSGSLGRAPVARPETANAEHQRLTPADDDVADVGASSANACSICGYRRRSSDVGNNFGSCESNVRECTASQNVPAPFRSQICTCSAAKAKRCTLNAQYVWDGLVSFDLWCTSLVSMHGPTRFCLLVCRGVVTICSVATCVC